MHLQRAVVAEREGRDQPVAEDDARDGGGADGVDARVPARGHRVTTAAIAARVAVPGEK
ncbi:hypothetical protein GCM10009687_28830 [Asanoa iriomotensis]|uniref:Uncharacterized protein n=1 Tax=Asanoa iriomotensis TaxID=234613 RepID=A0ABQ4CE38_9ACTN|nr:hypothetical protein Air01nite_71340 [Asanoa iriomotensis]